MSQEAHSGGGGADTIATVNMLFFPKNKPEIWFKERKVSDAVQFYKVAFGTVVLSSVCPRKRKANQKVVLTQSAELKLGVEAAVEEALKNGAIKHDGKGVEDICHSIKSDGSQLKDPYSNVWLIVRPCKKSDNVEA